MKSDTKELKNKLFYKYSKYLMNECPICYENHYLVTLGCSHSFCSQCINRWRISCPICRSNNVSRRLDISTNNFLLQGSIPRRLNISISSPKGTSVPIQDNELSILKSIFGNFNRTDLVMISNFDKIIFQNYLNNCWWIGKVLSLDGEFITIDNSIYLQRQDGLIYNAFPLVRKVKIGERDTYFILDQ